MKFLYPNTLRDSLLVLVGYLGFNNTKELRTYLFNSSITIKYLIPFKKAKDKNFSYKIVKTINTKALFLYLYTKKNKFKDNNFKVLLPLSYNR